MTERGVFAVHRGWFDHPVFAREKFTEREAWAWLISEASWKKRTRRIGDKFIVDLERGQLAASLRHLAEVWQWTKGKVEWFLKKLKSQDMVQTDNKTGICIITICNYDKYQRVSLPDRTANETPNRTATGQQQDNTEDIKTLNTTAAGDAPPPMSNLPDWFTPSDLVLDAMGIDKDFRGSWSSQRPRLQVWLSKWDLERDILPTVQRLMATRLKAGRGPPNTLAFFEGAIADAFASRTAPLPIGTPERATNAKPENLSDTARRLATAGISFGERPRPIGVRADPDNVRMLPPRRGEQS